MRKLVIAIMLISILGIGAAAAEAAPRKFFGTVAFHDPSAAEFNRMGRGKVGTYRTNFYWAGVEPQGPGARDWSRYDALIGRAASNGIRVVPTVYGSPPWAAAKANYPPRPAFRDEFKSFMRAAAQRYGPGGDFWALAGPYRLNYPNAPIIPIRFWQLWNEMNSPSYWLPRPHAKQYKPLLVAASRGVKSVNPGAQILLGGLFSTPRIKNGVFMNRWLKQLYRAGGRKWFDAMAVHPYQLTPKRAIGTVRWARRVMRKHRDRKKPIWITEVGWATSGKRTQVTVKPKRQARYLRRTFRLAAKNRKRLRIGGVIWFSFKDTKRRLWIYRTGLFTRGFKPKPSWRSFVRFTGGKP